MTLVNGSFETQATGSGPGVADGWTAVENYTAEEYAEFVSSAADNVSAGYETFEGEWPASFDSGFIGAYQGILLDLEPAFFGPAAVDAEGFERDWGLIAVQGPFDYETLPLVFADFNVGGFNEDPVENFETWASVSQTLLQVLTLYLTATPASFDTGTPQDFEDFEEEWGANENYLSAFVGIGTDLTAALFTYAPATTQAVEGFVGVWFDTVGASYAPATDVWTFLAHGLTSGPADIVTLENSSGRIPDGYLLDTVYYVQNATANTFQLAPTDGGTVVDGTDAGFGTHIIHHDENVWWTEELTGV